MMKYFKQIPSVAAAGVTPFLNKEINHFLGYKF